VVVVAVAAAPADAGKEFYWEPEMLPLVVAMAGVAQGLNVSAHAAVAPSRVNVILPANMLTATMDADDTAVIRAVLDGQTERYAELVDRYQQPALRLAYSLLGSVEDARDASQEAFVSAYLSLGRFRGRSKFSTWFYRIIVNKCHDLARMRSRLPHTVSVIGPADPEAEETIFVEVEDHGNDPHTRATNRELARELSLAIKELSIQQRVAFALHHLQGLSLEEAASVMGCRVGTVKSHVFRATESLRKALAPWRREVV